MVMLGSIDGKTMPLTAFLVDTKRTKLARDQNSDHWFASRREVFSQDILLLKTLLCLYPDLKIQNVGTFSPEPLRVL